jgi:hypothetical protein
MLLAQTTTTIPLPTLLRGAPNGEAANTNERHHLTALRAVFTAQDPLAGGSIRWQTPTARARVDHSRCKSFRFLL